MFEDNCNNCKNKVICKWVESFQTVQTKLEKIEEVKVEDCPVSVSVQCSRFEKQSNFFNTRKKEG